MHNGFQARRFLSTKAFDERLAKAVIGQPWNVDPFKQTTHSTMQFQNSLPQLPIPKLENTCKRYLDTVTPLLTPSQLEKTKKIVLDFQTNEGLKLHEKLLARNKANPNTSYISAWWFDMYLRERCPLPLNINPFIGYREDPNPAKCKQVERTASLINSICTFKQHLMDNTLPPDVFQVGSQMVPLDMSQYGSLFNSTRIPKPDLDVLLKSEGDHVAVLFRDNVYKVTVMENGKPISQDQVAARFRAIVNKDDAPPAYPISILTSEERNTWAKVREQLESLPTNKESLRIIDSAIIVITLCDEEFDYFEKANLMSHTFLHGFGRSRWWDKSLSLIVTKNGTAGVSFEHSWGDGVAVLRMLIDTFNHSTSGPVASANEAATEPVQMLNWELSDNLQNAVIKARDRFLAEAQRLDLQMTFAFGCGKTAIEKITGVKADAFMQIAFQLAYYRVHRAHHSVYESASTASYKHGRTECLRPVSIESAKFVRYFDDQTISDAEKVKLFYDSIKKHGEIAKLAKQGEGCDRHLYGLQKMAALEGLDPLLYKDDAYKAMKSDMLSTSSLSSAAIGFGGFGPVSPGYGIGYCPAEEMSLFNVTSWQHKSSEFVDQIVKAIGDILAVSLKIGKSN